MASRHAEDRRHSTILSRSPPTRTPRRYGFSCSNCRNKKIKCSGEKPTCRNCRARADTTCVYESQSPRSAQLQLRQAHEQIRLLQERLDAANTSSSPRSDTPPTTSLDTRERLENSAQEPDEQAELFWTEVSIDGEGSPNFHGSTSRFHVEVTPSKPARVPGSPEATPENVRSSELQSLAANAELLKVVWEPLALAKLEQDSRFPPKLASTLMNIYWTWQHPLHNFVYRPCFFRDLALGGPYYSEFLLLCIFALAAKHVDDKTWEPGGLAHGEKFLHMAKTLLLDELSQPKPRIPTIQGLLILGGRQCAVGNSSEGWLYTGMAIRMMKDAGLHLNPQKLRQLENLDAADLEARKRLYLSAYIWDKSISICLGRPPTLNEMPRSINDTLDEFDDSEMWAPVFHEIGHEYPPTQCYNTATFKEFCRLGGIISQVYSYVYSKPNNSCSGDILKNLENRLTTWYDNLPLVLRIANPTEAETCPPPHIFTLNILYHTILILIYRPCLQLQNIPDQQHYAEQICSSHSVIINDLFLLHGRTFNYRFMTYLTSYCIYTAATINVHDIKHPSSSGVANNAAARLSVSLRVLECEAQQTPGIHRSIDIIKSQLRTWNKSIPPLLNQPLAQSPKTAQLQVPNTNMAPSSWALSSDRVTGATDNALQLQQSESVDTSEFEISNGIFMDAGGGFQPNAFHWTLDDFWNLDTQF